MKTLRDRQKRAEGGFISVEILGAVAMSFLVLAFLLNIIIIQYGRGVIRAAADDGARSGGRVHSSVDLSVAACENRANSVIDGLGKLAQDVTVSCTVDAATGRVQSVVDAKFEPWAPGVPTITEHSVGYSVQERAPA